VAALFEAVPNVSEGRRPEVIAALAASVAGAHLLDSSSDPDHDRTVLTIAGSADVLIDALERLYAAALAAIDLRVQRGAHPRIGAVDVVPFVPLAGGATMSAAAQAAWTLAARVGRRFDLPVYLYEAAARRADRRSLPEIRRGEFEGLPGKLATPGWEPDFGPRRPHPSAGATVIGARRILVAFNVVLASRDLALARLIARSLRPANGGLPAVRALGVPLRSRGAVQVSFNLLDTARTSPLDAFDAVVAAARAAGVDVEESEIVGLAPRAALPADPARLRLRDASRCLEDRLAAAGLEAALDAAQSA
jgi:glutamate formiminotransferase